MNRLMWRRSGRRILPVRRKETTDALTFAHREKVAAQGLARAARMVRRCRLRTLPAIAHAAKRNAAMQPVSGRVLCRATQSALFPSQSLLLIGLGFCRLLSLPRLAYNSCNLQAYRVAFISHTSGGPMAINPDKLNEFLGRALVDFGATFNAALVRIGDKLGLYKALAAGGPQTAGELAKRTGTSERYV